MPSFDSQTFFQAFTPNPQPSNFGAAGVQHFPPGSATAASGDRRPLLRGCTSLQRGIFADEKPLFASENAIRFRLLRGEP